VKAEAPSRAASQYSYHSEALKKSEKGGQGYRDLFNGTSIDPDSRKYMSVIKEAPVSRRSPTGRQLFANTSLAQSDLITKMSVSLRSKISQTLKE
jgi:hypothetical protein